MNDRLVSASACGRANDGYVGECNRMTYLQGMAAPTSSAALWRPLDGSFRWNLPLVP